MRLPTHRKTRCKFWTLQQESNLHSQIRNLRFYPLNYGELVANERLELSRTSDGFLNRCVYHSTSWPNMGLDLLPTE